MGLYLELGFFVFLSTPFLGLALAPKIKLVTSILLASVLKFFKEFKNLLDPFTTLRWDAFEEVRLLAPQGWRCEAKPSNRAAICF